MKTKTFPPHTHTIILMLILLLSLGTAQKANASAKAGEATVDVGSTVSISLADAYRRTLMSATNVSYDWYSDNDSYATVVSSTRYNATVRGIKATSSCKIYFRCSYFIDGYYRTMDFYYTIKVIGRDVSVTDISLNHSSLSLKEGSTAQLTPYIYPSNATNQNVSWQSSNTSVATVSVYGLVSAKSAGTTTVYCRATDGSGAYAKCIVDVEASKVYVSAITLNKTSASMQTGETVQLSASVSPTSATDKSVSWTSSSTSVATVTSDGLVMAKSPGTATVTCRAKDGSGKSAACTITVKEKSTGESKSWTGKYTVASKHVTNNPTKEYADNFEMTIDKYGRKSSIISMFGENVRLFNDQHGMFITDNGDGTATIDISYYNILKYTDNDSPLYALYTLDESAEEFSDTWTLKMNDDGTVTPGDFYIVAFTWDKQEEKWKNGQIEAFYYSMTATRDGADHIANSDIAQSRILVAGSSVILNSTTDITIYKSNGAVVYSGKTNRVDNLPEGLYIVKTAAQSKKILIKNR